MLNIVRSTQFVVNMADLLRVWSKFLVKNSAGTVINLRVVDMPKNLYEHYSELFINYFVREESTIRASGVLKSPEAMAEFREALSRRANDESFHTVICCLSEEDSKTLKIIGASTMQMITKPEDSTNKIQMQVKTDLIKKLLEVRSEMSSSYDITQKFNLDRYLKDRGVFVLPDYRGLGIAQELLRVRRMICKENGIPVHGAWMTSYGTQKAAERDGWETVFEINYEEYGKKYGVVFKNGPPSCKFMIAKIF